MKVPILLPNIFNYPFTYQSDTNLKVGEYVIVPFGKTKMVGVVWNHFEKKNEKNFHLKKIIKRLKINPLNEKTIKFLNWFSQYNLIPKGMSLKLHLLSNEAIEEIPDKEFESYRLVKNKYDFTLSKEQEQSLDELKIKNKEFRVHVLQGTTGSGKTIVYFNSIKDKIDKGYQGLILLPEIGLTSEFEKKFIDFFGFIPAIWHSGITKKKKKIIWNGLTNGKIKVVIGARSALFLPFSKLGIIVVDEEHDQSYKQDEGVIYNARDMAISRASFENIPIDLVSAVPSIETYENIKKKKYSYSRIISRYKIIEDVDDSISPIDFNEEGYPGLCFSGGADSAAALSVMPGRTIPIFLNRPLRKGSLYDSSAPLAICKLLESSGYNMQIIESNLEYIRIPTGFPTDLANAIPAIATNILMGCLVSKSQARGIFLFFKIFFNSTTAENEQ